MLITWLMTQTQVLKINLRPIPRMSVQQTIFNTIL